MKPFHIRGAWGYSRAFILPTTLCARVRLWLKGWRPHYCGDHWQKGSRSAP